MKLTIILFAAMLLTIHCGPGEPVEYANACNPENNKKYIEVSGIIDTKGGVFCSNTSGPLECGFKLLQNPGDEKGISSDITVGSWSNNVEKPESGFKREDVKIRDNKGEFVKLGEKVKLTGEITAVADKTAQDGVVCYLKVSTIDKQ